MWSTAASVAMFAPPEQEVRLLSGLESATVGRTPFTLSGGKQIVRGRSERYDYLSDDGKLHKSGGLIFLSWCNSNEELPFTGSAH